MKRQIYKIYYDQLFSIQTDYLPYINFFLWIKGSGRAAGPILMPEPRRRGGGDRKKNNIYTYIHIIKTWSTETTQILAHPPLKHRYID